MAKRTILQLGDPTLRKVSRPVKDFDSHLWTLLDDMWETLLACEGLGLAAPQVGILKRAVVIDYEDKRYEMINPEILEVSGESIDNEGCLSVQGFRGLVKRPKYVKVRYFDRHGGKTELEGNDYFARCILHELDHLEGVLFVDKMIRKIPDED